MHGQVLTAGLFSLVWRQLSTRYSETFRPDIAADSSQREAVAPWISGFRTKEDLIAAFEAAGVAWADVRDPMDVFSAPWAVARQVWATVPDGGGGERKIVQSPYRFSDASSGVHDRAPHRGEHNRDILHGWLGWGDTKIEELAAMGVVRHHMPAKRT